MIINFLENGVTGHRGNLQHFPENTLAGFDSAIKMKCDWVETDLRLTKDNRIVLSHDGNTGRTADKNCVIRESTCEDLSKLNMAAHYNTEHNDLPPRVDRIPLLEEALELFRSQNSVRLSLQPKDPGSVEAAAKIIRQMKFPPEMIGFNDGTLDYMISARNEFPEAEIFYDRTKINTQEDIAISKKYRFNSLVVHYSYLNRETVGKIAEAGISPGVWTVNNPPEPTAGRSCWIMANTIPRKLWLKRWVCIHFMSGFFSVWHCSPRRSWMQSLPGKLRGRFRSSNSIPHCHT